MVDIASLAAIALIGFTPVRGQAVRHPPTAHVAALTLRRRVDAVV